MCEADDGNHSSGSSLWDRMRDTEFGTWDKTNVSYDCNFMFFVEYSVHSFFFQGLAYLFDRICRKLPGKKLWTFTCRQLQEAVFLKSSSLAISSLLILFAIICCSYGVGMSGQLGQQDTAGIDFTFDEKKETLEEVLSSQKVDQYFSNLFEVRNGLLWTDLVFYGRYGGAKSICI